MLEKILAVFVLCGIFCNANGNAANASAEQLLGHWMVVTEHNTYQPLNMAQNTCVSIFKDFNENLKFKSGDDLPLFDVVQRMIPNKKEFFIHDGEQEAKLVKVYPNELVWESKNELVVFYRIGSNVFLESSFQFGSIRKKSPTKKFDDTLFDAKSLEYWFPQLPKEQLSSLSPKSINRDKRNTITHDKPNFIAHGKPNTDNHDKPKFIAENKNNSFIERWERNIYNFHKIPVAEVSPRTILHYPKLGLTKQLDENLYQKNLHSCRGAYGQAFKKLNKRKQSFNLWKNYCKDQRSSEYECYRTPHRLRKAEIDRSFEKCKYFYPRNHFEPRKFSEDTDSADLMSTRDSSPEELVESDPAIGSENSTLFDNMAQNLDLLDNMAQNMINNALENEQMQKCARCGNILWNSKNGMCTQCTAI